MASSLNDRTIAILATDGFEQVELTEPKRIFEEAGIKVTVIAPEKTQSAGKIRGWYFKDWGESVPVDRKLGEASPEEFDALMLPGGVLNPDKLRLEPKAIQFVKDFAASGKPVAAICHGPWTLVDAGLLRGRNATSYPSIKIDLQNAGAEWTDKEVVIDGQFITSRKPDDIPAFAKAVIEAVAAA